MNILVSTLEISENVTYFQYSRFHMSHFCTSQATTAFYPKLGCIQFSFHKLQMLTAVHNDTDHADNADDTDNTDDTDDNNRVIGIALLKAFSCAKMRREAKRQSIMGSYKEMT